MATINIDGINSLTGEMNPNGPFISMLFQLPTLFLFSRRSPFSIQGNIETGERPVVWRGEVVGCW